MTCAACAARIERKLTRLEGVEATVNFAADRAAVAFDPARVQVGQAIAHAARSEVGTLPAVEHFRNRPGLGVVGTGEGHEVTVGRGDGGIEVAWDGDSAGGRGPAQSDHRRGGDGMLQPIRRLQLSAAAALPERTRASTRATS